MISKKTLFGVLLAFGVGTLVASGHAFAHAALKSSSPKNGATITAPKTLQLQFEHPTKLAKLTLLKGSKEVPVSVDSSAPATQNFAIPLPALEPGKYEVKWAALGADAHPMTGGFSFTVSDK